MCFFRQEGGSLLTPTNHAQAHPERNMTLSDLLTLLTYFMQPVTKANAMYDFNADGIISTSDLIIMLGMLG